MEKNNTTCCLIFTRNPEPGKTKTRLMPEVGINGAYEIHLQLLKFTLALTAKISDIEFQLHYTSHFNNQLLLKLAKKNNLTTHLQTGNDLGERMYYASLECLKNYSYCIIIGTDCPDISKQYLLDAKHYLNFGYDAVIGPAQDGGYVLIGMKNANKKIFENITWGKNNVLIDTLNNFEKLNFKYKKLSTLHDIDTKEDLKYLKLMSE